MATNTSSTPHNLFATPDLKSQAYQFPKGDIFLSPNHSQVVAHELIEVARSLVNPRGKGIYATDESPDVIEAMLHNAAKDQNAKQLSEDELKQKRREWREASYNALTNGMEGNSKCLVCNVDEDIDRVSVWCHHVP
jgi:fructose-bisphosphate aldolase, class I